MPQPLWKKRGGECVYCGKFSKPLTEDHIPPECLFPLPLPSNLIKIRCCTACNAGASADDEYFKRQIVLSQNVKNHPEAKKLIPSVQRSLEKLRPFDVEFLRSLHYRNALSLIDGTISTKLAYPVDMVRLERVVQRITLGLYWRTVKNRLPDDCTVDVLVIGDNILKLPLNELENFTRVIIEPLSSREKTVIGADVFSYRYTLFDGQQPGWSAWLMTFFGGVPAVSLTRPKNAFSNVAEGT